MTSRQYYPARAIATGNFLVVHARPIGLYRWCALLKDAQLNGVAGQGLARFSGERTIGVVGISNQASAVATYDHVALRGEQAARAFFRLAQFPVAVRQFLIARCEQTHGGCDCALTDQQESDRRAGRGDQRAGADGGAGRSRSRCLAGARRPKPAAASDRQCNERRADREPCPIAG